VLVHEREAEIDMIQKKDRCGREIQVFHGVPEQDLMGAQAGPQLAGEQKIFAVEPGLPHDGFHGKYQVVLLPVLGDGY